MSELELSLARKLGQTSALNFIQIVDQTNDSRRLHDLFDFLIILDLSEDTPYRTTAELVTSAGLGRSFVSRDEAEAFIFDQIPTAIKHRQRQSSGLIETEGAKGSKRLSGKLEKS